MSCPSKSPTRRGPASEDIGLEKRGNFVESPTRSPAQAASLQLPADGGGQGGLQNALEEKLRIKDLDSGREYIADKVSVCGFCGMLNTNRAYQIDSS